MSIQESDVSLGEWLRDARVVKKVSLRALAGQLQITPSYLSDIENDRRIPGEDVLLRITQLLEIDFDEAMARAGRFGLSTERYLKAQPEAVRLFRRISEANLTADELRQLQQSIQRRKK